ncbi:SRPBCC family protein [Streptomyces xantholiticus]|uniref:SRPBCC family protein n=1 Tax=Streptomyces xantholiticus TaxID=68285 RepID=A0ABV1UYH1_9ACTN
MTDNGFAKGGLLGSVDSEVRDRLKEELRSYVLAHGERMLTGLGRTLGEGTSKLEGIAQGRSPGFTRLAVDGGRKLAEGKGPVRSAVELGAGRLKDTATDTLKGLLGSKRGRKGGGGQKPTVILESVDVGVPVREAYNQWTRYQDFPTFARGVKSASPVDDTRSDWNLKVFWSSRSWKARTTEQTPDSRICWTSEGAKGTAKGVVTFHPLGDSLTRVLLIIEYHPKGLFEKSGNLWRAQGRRVRLDLKHFARHVSLRGESAEGRRAEISDGEVVRTHEDVVAEEEGEVEPLDETYDDEEYEHEAEPDAEAVADEDEAEPTAADAEDADDSDADDAEYEEEEPYDEEPEPVGQGAGSLPGR